MISSQLPVRTPCRVREQLGSARSLPTQVVAGVLASDRTNEHSPDAAADRLIDPLNGLVVIHPNALLAATLDVPGLRDPSLGRLPR